MTKIKLHPRVFALILLVGGAALVVALAALGITDTGGRGGTKAIMLLGIAGIAAGVGLTQLLWPPRPAALEDERSAWQRAPVLQKIVWIFGGVVGVVASAVSQVVLTGKY